MGSRGQAVMIVECVKINFTNLNLSINLQIPSPRKSGDFQLILAFLSSIKILAAMMCSLVNETGFKSLGEDQVVKWVFN